MNLILKIKLKKLCHISINILLMKIENCLVCNNKDLIEYLNLGYQPLANNLSKKIYVNKFPLKISYCKNCFHNQLTYEIKKEKLFSRYFYLSSQSNILQKHFYLAAKKYTKIFKLNKFSKIIDVGSNDGIALKYYKKHQFKNFFGIEPAKNVSNIANSNGLKTINSFLNLKLSKKYYEYADIVTASNVFAHNKDIKKLSKYLLSLVKKNGVLIIEVQYLVSMIKNSLFDNIYHEHIHYWSINALNNLFKNFGCTIIKIEKINTHGGSIRCYVKKKKLKQNSYLKKLLREEIKFGINKKSTFINFAKKIKNKRNDFKKFLVLKKNKIIVGYGAAAKTSTLLNYLKISKSLRYIIDDNKLKQDHYIPGTKIKIVSKNKINKKIDYLIVFAWNYFNEIKKKVNYAKKIISIRKFF